MGERGKMKWNDVVSQVQHAGVEEQNRIREEQRSVNKMYVDILEEEIAKHREELRISNLAKVKERRWIEEESKREVEKRSVEKQQKKNRQRQYMEMNHDLVQRTKEMKTPPPAVPQHPFIKLVDFEQKRQHESRQKMKLQNNMNSLQTKIKNEQRRQLTRKQKQQKDQYINYVDKFYDRKIEDRNIFKRKYLKLNNLQKSNFINNNNHEENIDKQYLSVNTNQIQSHTLRKKQREDVDAVLIKINQHNDQPSSSPAFLGRNPINHDRRRQLECIHKGFGPLRRSKSTMKTNADVLTSDIRQSTEGKELPALERYYTKNLKINNVFGSPSEKILPNSEQPNASYKIKAVQPEVKRFRINTEPSDPKISTPTPVKNSRKFMTFDIILGRQKEVFI